MTTEAVKRARAHVVANSGSTQFALLVREGLTAKDSVCEYGCGMLDLARWLVPYLGRGRYTGVDPTEWVRDAVLEDDPELATTLARKGARLLSVEDFAVGGTFRFVYAHSVLSHAADHQLTQFLRAAPIGMHGTLLASLRVGKSDTNAREWVYPDVTYFTRETVENRAAAAGFLTFWRDEYRDLMMTEHPDEFHDWVVFRRGRGRGT